MRGQLWVDIEDQLQVLGCALLANQAGHILQHRLQFEWHRLDIQLAGLDFAQVEDVVDQPQQVLPRALNFFHIVALLGIQRCAQHQMAHADDRIHRRADFMAHIGQKIRLQLRRALGLGPGNLQFLFMFT